MAKQRIRPFLDNLDAIWRRASYQLAMDEAAARDKLLRHGWLSMMPPEFSAALLDICVWKTFSENAPLYLAGDPPGGIYGVAEGTISVTIGLGRADSPPANFCKAVVWTGLGPLLSGQTRRATIMVTETVFAAYAPLPQLQALLSAQPGWWLHIAQEMLIEFDLASTIANDLLIRSARRRCAAMLGH
jgi:CRP-like cAMP-binding protein